MRVKYPIKYKHMVIIINYTNETKVKFKQNKTSNYNILYILLYISVSKRS